MLQKEEGNSGHLRNGMTSIRQPVGPTGQQTPLTWSPQTEKVKNLGVEEINVCTTFHKKGVSAKTLNTVVEARRAVQSQKLTLQSNFADNTFVNS